ncbi:MAG: hypothetical protein KKG59_02565 [Nanoarchaeota archaeon]|nr:hypothetical protein [Nanoarchaeota archaeon]
MAQKHSVAQNLVKHGFIKAKYRKLYAFDSKSGTYIRHDGDVIGSHADQEIFEETNVMPGLNSKAQYNATSYPPSYKRYRLVMEQMNQSIEEPYYWMLHHLRQDQQFPIVEKITDLFSASENSAFFGQSAQRLSRQQEVAGQYLATIGRLTKEFFPMIRELRVLDERLEIYQGWGKVKSADITLKGLFIDFAEGGTKNPSSVYGLAQQVGFAILPDLFFNTHIYDTDDIDRVVDAMKWNLQVKNILKRKLHQYITWTIKTKEELVNRRTFTLKYLRQHWNIVRMYISWVKPYLRRIRRLHMNEKQMSSPDIVNAFESSMTEIEFLARKPFGKGYWACCLCSFRFRTRPTMQYRQDYNQGPLHVGQLIMDCRAYGWTDDQVDGYKRMREEEDLDMIELIDQSLKDAMDAFGGEIKKYLREAGELIEEEEATKESKSKGPTSYGLAEPFVQTVKGFGELFGALVPLKIERKAKGKTLVINKVTAKKAGATAEAFMYQAYKNFKKARGMLTP